MTCFYNFLKIKNEFYENNLFGSCKDLNNDKKCQYAQKIMGKFYKEIEKEVALNNMQYDICINNYFRCLKETKKNVLPTMKFINYLWFDNNVCTNNKLDNILIINKCLKKIDKLNEKLYYIKNENNK